MRDNIEQIHWPGFFSEFSERNRLRPTRLEVIGQVADAASDFWLEDGLPLAGISLDSKGEAAPQVEIMLDGAAGRDTRHLTHTIAFVRLVGREIGDDDRDVALEIEDKEGVTTILRFE